MPQVNFGNEKVGVRRERAKFRKGWNRFCFLETTAEHEITHFEKGHKVCTKKGSQRDQAGRCYWCDVEKKEPEDHFAAHIVHYLTDDNMNPLGPFGPNSFKVTWLEFGSDKWQTITMAKKSYGDIRAHDFSFQCTEEKWQRGQLQVLPEAWWLQTPDIKAMVAAAYHTEKVDLAVKLSSFLPYEQQFAYVQQNRAKMAQNQQFSGAQPFNPVAMQQQVAAAAPQPQQFAMPSLAPAALPANFAISGPPPNHTANASNLDILTPSPQLQQTLDHANTVIQTVPPMPMPGEGVDLDKLITEINQG